MNGKNLNFAKFDVRALLTLASSFENSNSRAHRHGCIPKKKKEDPIPIVCNGALSDPPSIHNYWKQMSV